ncbi:MAG TPA: TAXI family TRAP transporter solute-binding subunit [Candidatus Limnocylindrales bacterium]|nr:TAXI family TRAP transporter solute-binding subunit [Candidatus Limnocylindrales bacterium]
MQFDKDALKDLIVFLGLPLLAVIAAFWFAARFVQPAPPDHFVMTTGADGGAYHLFAQRYRDIVKRENITITLKPSAGSIENLQRLQDDKSEFDVGLIQAGVAGGVAPTALRSLGAVSYEPLWVFYRGADNIEKLSQLAGKRIAVGPEGSGTRALALQLLKVSGIDPSAPELVPFGGNEAVKALLDEDIEAAILVASPDAPTVRELANAKDVKLASLIQAEAFTRRFPFLTALQLPRGAIDLANDLPGRDVTLLATTANLVVKEHFHPALGYLLLQAASEVHGRAGVLQKSGEFPAPRESEIAIAAEAQRYFKSGQPFLQRYLPFWMANLIERLAVLLLPLVAVVLPLFKILPVLIQWRNKSRVFKWYGELKYLETQVATNADPAPQLDRYFERLDEIEDGVSHTRIGASYSDYVYNLRLHIELVRNHLHRLEERASETKAHGQM